MPRLPGRRRRRTLGRKSFRERAAQLLLFACCLRLRKLISGFLGSVAHCVPGGLSLEDGEAQQDDQLALGLTCRVPLAAQWQALISLPPFPPAPQVGEELDVTCVLRFQGRLWMCLSNGGGRSYTSLFLHSRRPRHTIFWPFGKPEDWLDCQDYVWRNGKPGFAHLDELAAALPLPEDTPTDPLPFELVPIPPPESDTRDDAIQAWLASLPGLMSSASTASVSGDVRM